MDVLFYKAILRPAPTRLQMVFAFRVSFARSYKRGLSIIQ